MSSFLSSTLGLIDILRCRYSGLFHFLPSLLGAWARPLTLSAPMDAVSWLTLHSDSNFLTSEEKIFTVLWNTEYVTNKGLFFNPLTLLNLHNINVDTAEKHIHPFIQRLQFWILTMPQPSLARRKASKFGHAFWVGGVAYSLVPVNQIHTSQSWESMSSQEGCSYCFPLSVLHCPLMLHELSCDRKEQLDKIKFKENYGKIRK